MQAVSIPILCRLPVQWMIIPPRPGTHRKRTMWCILFFFPTLLLLGSSFVDILFPSHAPCFVVLPIPLCLLPFPVLLRILSYVYLLQAVCVSVLVISVDPFFFASVSFFIISFRFLIDLGPAVHPHTLSFHVVSRLFFPLSCHIPIFLTDGLEI